MRLDLDGLDVFFPYDFMYPEQYDYMLELKRSLDAKGHCLLEMPTGTGKTVCLISLITSYQFAHPEVGKLIYCTRTVPEMMKCIEELKRVIGYRKDQLGPEGEKASTVLALCLSSRRNLCIHERVIEESDREAVDGACRDMTASWVRKKAEAGGGGELCEFFEGYSANGSDAAMPNGIYSLDDLKEFGKEKGWCPYFLARHIINHANVLVYNYQYMLDPKVAGMVSRELEAESVVVFDEAHNIDNVCTEALSVDLDKRSLDAASRCLGKISSKVAEMKRTDQARLNAEYQRLVSGLADSGLGRASGGVAGSAVGAGGAAAAGGGGSGAAGAGASAAGGGGATEVAAAADAIPANPALPADILQEAVPGNIRRAEHFVSFMRKVVEHFKTRVRVQSVESETPLAFVHRMQQVTALERKPLKFAYSRLNSLLRTLEVTGLDDFRPLVDVADFATLVGTYTEGFAVVIEPTGSVVPGVYEPVMRLACLDASLAIRPVFERFASVVITSGTLSPLDLYPKLLGFSPVVRTALSMSTVRKCICPLVVTRGSDQLPMSTKFDQRDDPSVVRNYGALMIELAAIVPDGVVCFFTSYSYMEMIVSKWDELGVLKRVLEKKLIFIETKDVVETTLALDNFKRACDCGRGAIFLSVARGKVAEGIDFDRHYGRAVVMFGVPFQYTLSHVLRARLEYLRSTFQIREGDFLTFDAIRQCAQCIGRVIRSKTDYGLVILADSRYNRHDKRSKLPGWVLQFLDETHLNMSADNAAAMARMFLKDMAQPLDPLRLKGTMLDTKKVAARNREKTGKEQRNPSELNPSAATAAGGRGAVDGMEVE
ncbi:unnamed protein product [Ectocarpus sp. 6 AP-2014]